MIRMSLLTRTDQKFESLVFATLVELQSRLRRIHLEVESRRLGSLLLSPGQFGEAIGEGIGNSEIHEKQWLVVSEASSKYAEVGGI